MPTVPMVVKIKRDWRYPHRENAYQYDGRPPAGFQPTEAPDWVTGTVRGTVPAPNGATKAKQEENERSGGFVPGGAVGSLFDED